MLAAAGITEEEERVYRALLDDGSASPDALVASVGINRDHVDSLLAALESKGLVSRVSGPSGTFTPTPPDVALEPLVLQRQEELQKVRQVSFQLMGSYRRGVARRLGGEPTDLIDIVVGRESIVRRFNQLQYQARHEIRVLDRPPYADPDPTVTGPDAYNPTELALLNRGVQARVIYDHESLATSQALANVESVIAAGERARVLHEVPMKLAIADDQLAMMPLSPDRPQLESAVFVHASSLLDALIALFERLWRTATPLNHHSIGDNGQLSVDEARLLSLLLAGLADEAIARQLGVSGRTVHRRIKSLTDRVGAQTRLQLIWQATQRGWL